MEHAKDAVKRAVGDSSYVYTAVLNIHVRNAKALDCVYTEMSLQIVRNAAEVGIVNMENTNVLVYYAVALLYVSMV